MEFWAAQLIISAVQAGLIIGGVVLVFRFNGFRKVTSHEFRKQQALCNKRFAEMAASNRDTKVLLKKIIKHLKDIEARLTKVEDITKVERKLKKRGAK